MARTKKTQTPTKQICYKLTFQLTKHKGESGFDLYTKVNDTDEITGYIENYANEYQHRVGTPIKCVKVEKIPDYPEQLTIPNREETKNDGKETTTKETT